MAAGNRKNPVRCFSSNSRYSLMEFMAEFPDDEACLQWLWKTRLSPDGEHAHCSKCNVERAFKRYATNQQRQSWTCIACGHHLHPTAGTIFHKSSTSLHLWFYAMYMITSTRCGLSAKQLGRELGVTYKTAWRIFNRIRYSLGDSDGSPLMGKVEMDESYFGGKDRNKHLSKRKRQASRWEDNRTVFGMVERKGRVIAKVVPTPAKSGDILPHVMRRVMPASVVFTDEARFYDPLARLGFQHGRVHHAASIYVSGDAHTNTIEGFWSLVKRGISGVYHNVSAKHLPSYVDEYARRYNHTDDPRGHFNLLPSRVARGRVAGKTSRP
jgi:transposase